MTALRPCGPRSRRAGGAERPGGGEGRTAGRPVVDDLDQRELGATAVLVIVHVAFWPSASVTEDAVDAAPPVHTQAEAV